MFESCSFSNEPIVDSNAVVSVFLMVSDSFGQPHCCLRLYENK